MKRKLVWGLAGLAGITALVFMLNETPFLYHEPSAYTLSDPTQYFSPLVAPVSITRPGHDTLILFLHGFPASPQDFRQVAERLADEYDVAVPLLPGFGTTPGAIRESYFSQWLAYARDEYLKARPRYRRVYLCGLSMGGLLALRLTESLDDRQAPDGLVLLSTPVFFNNLWGAGVLCDWRLYFSRFLSWFLPELHTRPSSADQDGAEWVGFKNIKFLKQIHSLKLGMRQARLNLDRVRVPVLLMHARGDKTVPFENVFFLARRLASPEIHVRLFDLRAWNHTRHLLTLYRTTQGAVVREIRGFIQEPRAKAGPAPNPSGAAAEKP